MSIVNFPVSQRPDPECRPLMSYSRVPTTEKAENWVRGIAAEIEAGEVRQRQRSEYDRERFIDALGRFLGDLVVTAKNGRGSYRSFPRGNDFYSQATVPISKKKAIAAYNGLTRLGLIQQVVNYSYNRKTGKGYCEVVQPTAAFQDRIAAVKLGDIDLHWTLDKRSLLETDHTWLPVIVKAMRSRDQAGRLTRADIIPGAHLSPKGKEEAQRMEERNGFIRGFPITGSQLLGWQRQFNGDLDHGGRLYAKPDDTSYQGLPPGRRSQLLINGCAVNEIDIRSSHLYFYLSKRLVDLAERIKQHALTDAYSVPGVQSRELAKIYVTAMFGQGKHPDRWPKGTRAKLGKKVQRIEKVKEALLAAYPELLEINKNWYWPTLFKIESDAVVAAMDRLRAYGTPSLPVHDSLIVPVEATALAVVCLREACTNIAGYPPLPFKISRDRLEVHAVPVGKIDEMEEDEIAAA